MERESGLAQRWRALLCMVVVFVVGWGGQARAEGTTVTGTSGAEVPLTIDPSSEPAVGTIDLSGSERVLVLDGVPKSMTLRRVTLGDLARATGCETDANAELRVYDDGSSGTLTGTELVATSTTSQALGPELERVSWIVDPTALSSGGRYVFVIRSSSGSCTSARIRTWAHNSSQVDGGARACALLEDGSTQMWRLWHRRGEDESRACGSLGPGCRAAGHRLDFPRFRGHLMAGPSGRPVRMSVDAKDTVVFVGVPPGGGAVVAARIDHLEQNGPSAKRPVVGEIKGSVHDPRMKELRCGTGSAIRVLFVFDPARQAVLLVGGAKAGKWNQWYREAIPEADKLYDDYIKETGQA